ncbi:hypothetical protein BE17_20930 [Sorangium cellulosum]|uniref:Uncharacterized protein n=1 Tax=Sorangium cellulosum TaxID=56 RepID=A0A150RUM3_SORCE|nr:hypothetical protein BE17_20930 [Sorangium cellulosum]
MRPCLSHMGKWERAWVREFGLDDIDWDPERCCEQCLARRAARGEAVEELVPPSGIRPKLLLGLDRAKDPPAAGDPQDRSTRRDMPAHLKLVRAPRLEPNDP